jgi:hypothetical protein
LKDEEKIVDEEILVLLPLFLTNNYNFFRYLNLYKN